MPRSGILEPRDHRHGTLLEPDLRFKARVLDPRDIRVQRAHIASPGPAAVPYLGFRRYDRDHQLGEMLIYVGLPPAALYAPSPRSVTNINASAILKYGRADVFTFCRSGFRQCPVSISTRIL